MNTIQSFSNAQFGELHTVEEEGKTLFCAKDVANALGYRNTNDAIAKHCKGVANRYPLSTAGGVQRVGFITEGNVYRLIASSKLPTAQRFESWVFDEVLPSIRRRGGYMVSDTQETPEQTMARALLIAKDAIERKDKIIEQQQPKALFADAVAASDGTCLVGELAKILKQNGVNVGQNRLFSMLRNDGFLGTSGSNYNVPTQKAMDLKLFRIKETSIQHSDGHVTINRTPKVTGKGQLYFVNKYSI
ncbi:MAG: phage antirepressor KilAC domain-containing protein [Eggerthellaceae bacterium]|jgi:anti-repressor protein|nr:phage antirepressor KilAC domain-containing protein [Eggerthellaceae bacterium]MCH4220466.1 phage antirepressor KilAC domain-containing protein [Eggerthellaceae bacterium]